MGFPYLESLLYTQYTQIMFRHMWGKQKDWETWSQMTLGGKANRRVMEKGAY